MTLTDFISKEEIINEQLYDKEIISGIFFEEIDFENELFTYREEIKNSEYGWYDIETHEVDFDELSKIEDGRLMEKLLELIDSHL
jgi:hypothetical protein